jgi:hypothetical protein
VTAVPEGTLTGAGCCGFCEASGDVPLVALVAELCCSPAGELADLLQATIKARASNNESSAIGCRFMVPPVETTLGKGNLVANLGADFSTT